MVSTPPIDTSSRQYAFAEKRVSLHVNWDGFQTILETLGEHRSAQLTYHLGTLEIMTPLEAHERASGLIGQFIEIVTEELNLTIKTMESTTLHRRELESGAEPDKGYYITNEPLIRGKLVNLEVDPPPDLVVEVDIIHTDINKNALYAQLSIPEFWRYNGQTLTIYQLQDDDYHEVSCSPIFPSIPKEQLYLFLSACAQQGETSAKHNLRVWIRENGRKEFI